MPALINDDVINLVVRVAARRSLAVNQPLETLVQREHLDFPQRQTLDPRFMRLAPGAVEAQRRHADELVLVVLAGSGELLIGAYRSRIEAGDVAFVPRWTFYRLRNASPRDELVLLSVSDGGFTSAVLGAPPRSDEEDQHDAFA